MVDLVVRGDTVVTPQGVGAYDIAIAGEQIVAVAARGSFPVPDGARLIDATGKIVMPGGIDPHVHCKWHLPNPDGSAGADRSARCGGPRRGAWRHHDDDRLHPRQSGRQPAGRDREARGGLEGPLRLRLRAAHHGGRRAAAGPAGPVGRSDPGRLPHGEDLHHRHHAVAQGAHGGFRRHLGSVPGAEGERRPRRDPLRGQRHRDAHVRQADPRGTHRLRQHGGGAQHAVGGHLVPPRHPAGREGRRRRST